jgi:phosphoribosylaminoimidazole-succinocarboxamide synthase
MRIARLATGPGIAYSATVRKRGALAARFRRVIGEFMARRKKVYEGKAKILYEGPEPGTLIQYFKDDGSAGATPPQAAVEGKGVLNNRLSEFFMAGLNSIGVPTHFIRRLNMREQLVRMAEIVPLEVVVRNFAAGEITARLGIPEGTALPRPIVEYYFKDEKLGNPMVAEEHIIAFGWASQQDLDDMVALALRVNDFLSGVMMGVGIRLADFRIEVGRIWEGDFMRLIVADEISPDSCRLWDTRGLEAPDREGLLREPGPLADVYTELARRLGVLPSNVTHTTKPTLIN